MIDGQKQNICKMKIIKSILLFGVLFIGIILVVGNNFAILTNIAHVSDSPSVVENICLHRIYKMQVSNITPKIVQALNENSPDDMVNLFIRVACVSGVDDATSEVLKIYTKVQSDPNYKSTVYFIITSIGLFNDIKYVPFLEALLSNYEEHSPQVEKYIIARSLFLLTGKKYNIAKEYDNSSEIHISSKLSAIHQTLRETSGRNRTYEEKLLLDSLFQPSPTLKE
jgi:hypothetical protein